MSFLANITSRILTLETTKNIIEQDGMKRQIKVLEKEVANIQLELDKERACIKILGQRAGIKDLNDFKNRCKWEIAHKTIEDSSGNAWVNVKSVCVKLGMSRQNYYASRKQRQKKEVAGDLLADLVRQERKAHPRIGVRKLYCVLQPTLKKAGIKIGRDRMFEELRKRGLLVPPLPPSTAIA